MARQRGFEHLANSGQSQRRSSWKRKRQQAGPPSGVKELIFFGGGETQMNEALPGCVVLWVGRVCARFTADVGRRRGR